MRRIVIWLASTVTVVVLLFGYHTSTDTAATAAGTSTSGAPAAPSTTTTPKASDPPTPSASSTPSSTPSSNPSSSGPKSYTGDVTQTRWGPVQVKITVTAGTISKVMVVQSPSGNGRDLEINSRALPVLTQETIDAQSAKIDMVSGATVTSGGYVGSLQSALDQAGI